MGGDEGLQIGLKPEDTGVFRVMSWSTAELIAGEPVLCVAQSALHIPKCSFSKKYPNIHFPGEIEAKHVSAIYPSKWQLGSKARPLCSSVCDLGLAVLLLLALSVGVSDCPKCFLAQGKDIKEVEGGKSHDPAP